MDKRPQPLRMYRDQMVTYIQRMYGVSKEKADQISLEFCREMYTPLTTIIEDNKKRGAPELKGYDLITWFDSHAGDLFTPSGSVYMQQSKELGMTIDMLLEFLANRKKHKKLMLKAKADGDKDAEMKNYYAQTLIKINMNALPGNYGSKYSLFYDKGNYNAITSSGRALIYYSYSEIEAVLGGNFAWFSIDELETHIISNIHHGINLELLRKVMKKYQLRWASREDLANFYKKTMLRYRKYSDGELARIDRQISRMTDEEVQYFYYFENFHHIFMENEAYFRKWFDDLFDVNNVEFKEDTDPKKLFDVEGALTTFVNVAFHQYLDPKNPKIQVYDLPKERPDLAKNFVDISTYVDKKLHELDDLFDIFIYTPLCRPNIRARPMMLRNSAVVSDTDSVIFTVKDWVEWYTGSVYDVSDKAYHIACCMIYWITKAVAHVLYKYSVAHGAKDKFTKTMMMKNEFLYPVMIVTEAKKHYAGIVSVQEGVILPKPEIDIKGVQFKGSDICKTATKFAEQFIEGMLEDMYKHGRISAHSYIDKVRSFEMRIYNDINEGKVDWFKPLSIKEKNNYSTPMSSNWYYWLAWDKIFAPKYGEIQLPTKVPVVPIIAPTEGYFEWLKKKDPQMVNRWLQFIKEYKRPPSQLPVLTKHGRMPEEIIPLIKITDIIYHNVKPCHLTLKQLPVNCGFEKDKLLYRDLYPVTRKDK